MSINDADSTPPVDTPADASDEAAAPPKRKRAPRKKAVDAAAEAAAPVPTSFQAPENPFPPREQAPVPAPVFPVVPAIEAAPAQVAAASVPADAAPFHVEAAPAAGAGESQAAPATGAAAVEGVAVEGAAGEGDGDGGRRGRNRRRGRRGGDRADRADRLPRAPVEAGAEGEASADAAPAAEGDPLAPAPDVGQVFAEVLSGAFDVEPLPEGEAAEAEPEPVKRVLAAEPEAPKLHKVLAQAGVGSRRDLEQMILEGRITVNGEPAHIGQRISFGDRIAVGGKPVRYRIAAPPPRVLAYHKPAGEVVSHDDPQQRPTVFRRLPRLQNGKWQSVGRLDINTEGLLLFTNSGELANQLMHPRFGVEREYAVRSLGVLGEEAKTQLLEGVDIDGQRCAFKSITDGGGEGANHWYRCVITEGRNREVRRLFETVGHAVSRLIRIRYGSVVLPRGLKRGVWVDLDDFDVRLLRRIAGGGAERAPRPEGEREVERRGNNRRGGKQQRGRGGNVEGPPREVREARGPRGPRPDAGERVERGEGGAIPNPLQQTFDKRAIQQERALRREIPEDGPIPNPLQQTYDKRALQRDRQPMRDVPEDGPIPNPLQQTYDKRFAQKNRGPGFGPGGSSVGGGGGGGGGAGRARNKKGGSAPEGSGRQPDPLQTAVGYIGGDAFLRKGGGRGGSRGGRSGGGGGGGNRGGRGR